MSEANWIENGLDILLHSGREVVASVENKKEVDKKIK